jgi:hypothetical protein
MDANQLAEGIARAVEVAKPAQEYCLFWFWTSWWPLCMTKAEWASWMQALGTIAAVIGAAWIAARQDRVARYRAKQQAVRKARSSLAGLQAVAELVREQGSLWLADAASKRRLAEEHLNIARSIEAEQLDLQWTVQVLALRSAGVHLVSALEKFEKTKARQDHPGMAEIVAHVSLEEAIREIEVSLSEVQKVIRNEHPGVRAYVD